MDWLFGYPHSIGLRAHVRNSILPNRTHVIDGTLILSVVDWKLSCFHLGFSFEKMVSVSASQLSVGGGGFFFFMIVLKSVTKTCVICMISSNTFAGSKSKKEPCLLAIWFYFTFCAPNPRPLMLVRLMSD